MRSMVGAILHYSNYKVCLAAGAQEAVELINKEHFYVILCDLVVRDGSGVELLDRIRSKQPHTPLVIVTAIQDVGVIVNSMRRGATDYLIKPFEREQLLDTVKRAIGRRDAIRDTRLYRKNLEEMVAARTRQLQSAVTDIERSYDITLEALGDALDLKDSETEGHSRRVTAYTIVLARAMNLDAEEIKTIARGAFLHDIGKIAIPDAILRKPGKLTPEEQIIMREHCARGFRILEKIPYLSKVAEIVHSHQEHYDGSGYPRGLMGNQIPIGARIFAIADTLDAITSDRPYRKANTFDTARLEILRCAGSQFDPAVVEAFVKIPTDLWADLRDEMEAHEYSISTIQNEVERHVLNQHEK